MLRLIAALQATLVMVGLLVLAMPAGLACCADLVDVHGGDCCESAVTDAMARSCCEGGEAARGERSGHSWVPSVLAISPRPAAIRANAFLRMRSEVLASRLSPARGLFELHSALLL